MSFLFKRLPSLTFCISTKHMAKQLNNADMDTMQSDLLNHVESIDVRGSHSHSLSTQGSSGGAASNSPPAAGADSDGLLPLPLRRSLTLPLSSSDYFTTDLHVEAPGGSSSQVGELDCKSSIGEGLDGQSGTNSSVPTTPGGESQHTLDWTASPCSQASKNSIASSFTFDDEHNSDVRNADARSCDGTDVHLTLCGGSTHLSDGGAKAEVDCVLSSTVDALLLADHFWVSSHNPSTSCDRVGHQQTIARDRWFVPEAMVESTGLWTTDEYASVAGYTYRGSGSGSASGLYPTDTSTSCSDEARRLCRPEHVRTAVPPVQIQKCDSEATGPLQQHTRSASLGIVGKTTGEEVCGSTSRVARQLLRLSATELEAAVDEQVRLMEDVMNEEAVGPLEDLSTLLHSSLMLTPATSPPSSPKSTTSSSSSSSSSSSDDSEDSDNDSDNGSIASGASLHSDESDSEDEATEEGAQHEDESCGTDDDDDEEEEDSNKPPPLVVSESEAVALALPKAPIASSAEQEKSTSPTAAPPDPDNSTTDIDAPTSLVADTETTSTAVTKRQSDEALANATCTHIRALAKELRKLPKQVCVSRTEGSMFVRFDPDAPYLLRCCLTGVRGTPYSYGVFVFDIKCPPDYPTSPPKVLHVTKGSQSIQAPHSPGGFSPNMHWDSGKVCLSLLGTWDGPGWLADKSNLYQVMSTILLMILAAPNP
jgi:ubiquitin-protein ligase